MIDRMQGHAVLILLIAACPQTRAKAPAPTPATGRCVPIAQADAEAGRARQRNDQRFNDQLTQRGLNLVALKPAGVESGEQIVVATVEMRTIGGVAKRVLVTPSWTCATETLQLAKNAQQELYVIQLRKRATGAQISACGCEPVAGASCGGAAVGPIKVLYGLPDDLTYKGPIDIEYDVDPDSVLFSGRQPDGSNCPLPPPPPP